MLLSIIIPVYNLEQYIRPCLNSIYAQNADTSLFQIVAIDDGSSDGSLSILREYSAKYGNIEIITQQNAGVSVARNQGLDKSVGEYVAFLDGDDFLCDDSLKEVLDVIQEESTADIFYTKRKTLDGDRLLNSFSYSYTCGELYNTKQLRPGWFINGGSMCGAFYRKKVLSDNGISFDSRIRNGEDTLLCYRLLTCNLSVCFIDVYFYTIRVREGSASRSADVTKAYNFKNNFSYIKEFLDGNELSREQIAVMHQAVYHLFGNMAAIYSHTGEMKIRSLINTVGIKSFLPLDVQFMDKRYKRKIQLLNFSPYLFVLLGCIKHRKERQV